MRDGDRAAARDLLAEPGNDAATATQHVAETHHDEARAPPRLPCLTTQRLTDHFSKALGGAHDIGRIHCLVGGDQHETLDLVIEHRLRDAPGAQHIVTHRLPRVGVLHHRHMLVGGGVENHVRPLLAKHLG